MATRKEYMIIVEVGPRNMSERVNKAMAQGWEPQGGVSMQSELYAQSMVRDLPIEKPEDE